VKVLHYYANAFTSTVHAAVLWTFSKLGSEDGVERPSVAVLCRSNSFVAQLSAILAEEHEFKNQTLPPVEHDVLWDADLSAAAAQVVGLCAPTCECRSNGAVPRHFADMALSPCAEFGNASAIPALCLRGPFLVSRFRAHSRIQVEYDYLHC
jgi:hypothetical protein